MRDAPTTRFSLLAALSDEQNAVAWGEFVSLYEPAIYRFVRKQGIQDADAQEVVQDVLLGVKGLVARETGRKPEKFRAWLTALAKNRIVDLIRKQAAYERHLKRLPKSQYLYTEAKELGEELRHQAFLIAAKRTEVLVTPVQWQSFWQTCIELQSAQVVAKRLGISVGNVYVSKCRVMERLKREVLVVHAQSSCFDGDSSW